MITEQQMKKLTPFIESMGDRFKDGLKILDYGYGKGILLEYMKDNLSDFEYYGYEVSDSSNVERIENEKNVKTCIGDDDVLNDFIEKSDVIFFRSIFTHLPFYKFEDICNKLKSKFIIFSTFISNEYHIEGDKLYGLDNCYRFVFYTDDMIKKYAERNGFTATYKDKFHVPHVDLYQSIYVME